MQSQILSRDVSYDIVVEHREAYLYARVTAIDGALATVCGYWKVIADARAKTQIRKLLVEKNDSPAVSTTNTFLLMTALIEMGLAGVKIAFVERILPVDQAHLFAETAAANRGLWIRIFETVEDAKSWLNDS